MVGRACRRKQVAARAFLLDPIPATTPGIAIVTRSSCPGQSRGYGSVPRVKHVRCVILFRCLPWRNRSHHSHTTSTSLRAFDIEGPVLNVPRVARHAPTLTGSLAPSLTGLLSPRILALPMTNEVRAGHSTERVFFCRIQEIVSEIFCNMS